MRADRGSRTHDLKITNHALWPTELYRQIFQRPFSPKRIAKIASFSDTANKFQKNSYIALKKDAGQTDKKITLCH